MTGEQMKALLQQAWSEVFQTESAQDSDDFFEIGGDSIKAVQLSAWLIQKGVKLDLADIFTSPTLGELAGKLTETEPMYVPDAMLTKEIAAKEMQGFFPGFAPQQTAAAPQQPEAKEASKPQQAGDQQVCTPNQQQAGDQQVCTPNQQQADNQQVCTPNQQQADNQQVCTPNQQQADNQQVCTPNQQQVCTPNQQGDNQQVCTPNQQQVCTPNQQGDNQQVCTPNQQQVCTPNQQQVCTPNQQQVCTPNQQQVCTPNQQQVCTPNQQQVCTPNQQQVCTPNQQQVCTPNQQQVCTPYMQMGYPQFVFILGYIPMGYPMAGAYAPMGGQQVCTPQQPMSNGGQQVCTPQQGGMPMGGMNMSQGVPPQLEKYMSKKVDAPIEAPNVIKIEKAKVGKPTVSAEQALMTVMQGLLPNFDRSKDFFEQGLTSFDTVKMVTRCGENGYAIQMKDIYMHSTFDELVKCMQPGE